jgi:hypothetical protein
MAKGDWGTCPNCGGNVTKDYSAYEKQQAQWNKETEGIEDTAVHGVIAPEALPSGGVGVCTRCGMAVGAEGSRDAALTEPAESMQMPVDSPEHADAPSAGTPVVHDVDPAEVEKNEPTVPAT